MNFRERRDLCRKNLEKMRIAMQKAQKKSRCDYIGEHYKQKNRRYSDDKFTKSFQYQQKFC